MAEIKLSRRVKYAGDVLSALQHKAGWPLMDACKFLEEIPDAAAGATRGRGLREMTREEAIWYLSPIAESAALPRYKEALGMAIAALKEQGTNCKKNCIANVDGRCAVDSCSGAMAALDIKRPLNPETAAMLYNMARKMFEDWKEKPHEQV